MNVRADLTYAQGLERVWSYRTRYDFSIRNLRTWVSRRFLTKKSWLIARMVRAPARKDGVFGYQERYGEERYSKSMVTGLMRPDATGTLAVWNLTAFFFDPDLRLNVHSIERAA